MFRFWGIYLALHRGASRGHAVPPALRTTLCVTSLEDRTTPTTVDAIAIQDAYESGAEGIIRIMRDGPTTDPLDVG